VDTYQIDVGDVRTLVARVHKEVFDLEVRIFASFRTIDLLHSLP